MVTCNEDNDETWIVVEPNRSASWQANRLLILIFAGWCGVVGLFFAALGLWPIIPFLGLEAAALSSGLYYVCWKLRHRHVLRFANETVVVEKGVYFPRFRWRLARSGLSLSVSVPKHPWDPFAIELCAPSERIAVGTFLNKDDSRRLLDLLRAQGLPVRNHSMLVGFQP